MSLEASLCRVPRHSSQQASEHLILLQPENGANAGLRDLARPPAPPPAVTVGSPLQTCLLPLHPDSAISSKKMAKTEHPCLSGPAQPSQLHPNHRLSDLPHVLLTPAPVGWKPPFSQDVLVSPVLQKLLSILQVLPVTNFPSISCTLIVQWFNATSSNLFLPPR